MRDLIDLIRIAFGKADCLREEWDVSRWQAALDKAERQGVHGVCNKAVEMLPETQKPDVEIKLQLAFDAENIAVRNAKMKARTGELYDTFSAMGLSSCVLKGQGTAALYPWPEARFGGDIDLWVDCPHSELVPLLRQRWDVEKIVYHNVAINVFKNLDVEIHFRPSWLDNPFDNRRLQRWFDEQAGAQFENFRQALGFAVPTSGFNCVYNMVHCFRHFVGEGLSLRQMMDYWLILQHSTAGERTRAYEVLASVHLKRFVASMMYALGSIFALEDEMMLCRPDVRGGKIILNELERTGDGEMNDEMLDKLRSDSLAVREFHKIKRLLRLSPIALREVLWTPYFQVCHRIWRMRHNYLKQ